MVTRRKAMKIYTGRAFTYPEKIDNKEILGNLASVFFSHPLPPKNKMSEFAIKIKSPITAFVSAKLSTKSNNDYDIRYFSENGSQFEICGHASFVTTKLLNKKFSAEENNLYYTHKQNKLQSSVKEDLISIGMPKYDIYDYTNKKVEILKALNIKDSDVNFIGKIQQTNDCLVELKDLDKLGYFKPNLNKIAQVCTDLNIRGLALTCESNIEDFDYEIRIFFPHLGIDEDVVCGSANCGIAPFWANKLGKNKLKSIYPYNDFDKSIGGVQYIEVKEDKIILSGYAEMMEEGKEK